MHVGYVVDGADSARDNEPEASRATLIGDQLPFVVLDQSPAGDQVLRLPLPPHTRLLSRIVGETLPPKSAVNELPETALTPLHNVRIPPFLEPEPVLQPHSCRHPSQIRHFQLPMGGSPQFAAGDTLRSPRPIRYASTRVSALLKGNRIFWAGGGLHVVVVQVHDLACD